MIKTVKILEHLIDDCVEKHSISGFKPHHRIFHNNKYGYKFEWWSRDHRKNRHPKIIPLGKNETPIYIETSTDPIRLWGWEWWNISWWVAQFFFWGSVVWTVNGVLAVWPLPDARLQNYLSGWTAFTGGLVFIFGGYAAFLEVINQGKTIKLGHLLKLVEVKNKMLDLVKRIHYLKALTGKQEKHLMKHKFRIIRLNWKLLGYEKNDWSWWLNIVQLFGALIFFTACAASIPGILPNNCFLQNSIYWMPQVIGAVFFIIASWMAMREVQLGIFRFPVLKIGWQVGFWNLVGAVGFFLCGLFGLITNTALLRSSPLNFWGASFSTLWGSVAFLIASYLMLIEILNRHKKMEMFDSTTKR
jgi:hypothetical protein